MSLRAPPYSQSDTELFSPDHIEDPWSLFAELRRERPVSRIGETGVHLVATWNLIDEAVQRDADFSANLTGVLIRGDDGAPATFELPDNSANQVIATADDPDHAVHRALAQPRLAASLTPRIEPRLRAWTREALEPWLSAAGGDFIPISEVIPARVVADLLGLPDGDVSRHRAWAMMGGDMLAGDVTLAQVAGLARETLKMVEYLGVHLDAARRQLRSEVDAPLLHALGAGVERGDISADQAIGIAVVMFGAGGESSAALIGSVVRRLATHPDLAEALRRDTSLIPRFVEEVARLDPPFSFHYRVVRRPCELGGVTLAAGDRLLLLWASANRDAAHFEDPDSLRLDRRHPKHHMSFGRGGHFCIGAPLARLEARVVLEEILDRTTAVSLRPDDPPQYARSIFVRRMERMGVDVCAAI